MSETDWQNYLNKIQLSYTPVILSCIGVLLAVSAFRDFVFTDFQPPIWLNLLNGIGMAIILVAGIVTLSKQLESRYVNLLLFFSSVVMCVKPAVLVLFDESPGSLVFTTTIFAIGLIFLSLRYLILLQSLTLVAWLAIVQDKFLEAQYFATFVAAIVFGSLGMWLQHIRVNQILRSFEIESRVQELETIVPICVSCNKTRTENGEWMTVERYIEARGDSFVSRQLCPDCETQ